MREKERSEAIIGAIKFGDDRTLAAVLNLPPFVTGLTPTSQAYYREEWRRARMPEECRRIDYLQSAMIHLNRGGQLLLNFWTQLYSASIVKAGERSEAVARAAMAEG
jgi:hypothetical protein